MSPSHVLAYSGLLAALVLLAAGPSRALAIVAALAAGLEVAIRLDLLHVSIAHLPLSLVLAVCLAIPALISWFKGTSKAQVTAGAVAAFVGLLQLAAYVPVKV